MKPTLSERLREYEKGDMYPFHMPGHKRNTELCPAYYGCDITEIDGFDSLHHAQGILLEAQQEAAGLYGSAHTFFSVNGSTGALLAAIAACGRPGARILMARNCHKSVYNGVVFNRLCPDYLYPKAIPGCGICGGISPLEVERALTKETYCAVVITSPTYEGILSDIPAIAACCHAHRVPLIVDEAHGAHFGFAEGFPKSAVQAGADLVVHSIHKTLPALTQTALLHLNGTLVSQERVRYYLSGVQTSSPSYLLMASVSDALQLVSRQGERLFADLRNHLRRFTEKMQTCGKIRLLSQMLSEEEQHAYAIAGWDLSRLVFVPEGISGIALMQRLRKKSHLELEMAGIFHAVAIATIMDTEAGFRRLSEALLEINADLEEVQEEKRILCADPEAPQKIMEPADAVNGRTIRTPLERAADRGAISGEFIYAYPPGIPLLAPGERVTASTVEAVRFGSSQGLSVEGLSDDSLRSILVCETEKDVPWAEDGRD